MTQFSAFQHHRYSVLSKVLYSILPLVLRTFYHTCGLLCCTQHHILTQHFVASLFTTAINSLERSISFCSGFTTTPYQIYETDTHQEYSYCRMVYHFLVDGRKLIEQSGVQAFKVPGKRILFSYSGTMWANGRHKWCAYSKKDMLGYLMQLHYIPGQDRAPLPSYTFAL